MKLVLQQKQTLNLKMTTELRQAIELLQYTTHDLHQYLYEQGLENPLIELVEKEVDRGDSFSSSKSSIVGGSSDYDPFKFIADNERSLYEHICEQINCLQESEERKKLLHYLALHLNPAGYLDVSEEELTLNFGEQVEEFDEAIAQFQTFDPLGVGARDLTECLLIQAKHDYPKAITMHELIENHLPLLATKKWNELTKALSITLEELKEIQEKIQTLDPKPCSELGHIAVDYLHPDIVIEEVDGEVHISLNDRYLPEVRLNSQYRELVQQDKTKYIQEHYRNLQWLQNSIEQRRTTILKIVAVLVEKQQAFFEKGFSALKPLTLKDVADEIEMHESTVSRATANKIVQTSKGSFELRSLFSTRLNEGSGEDLSQTKLKMLLEDIIKQEDKKKPLSDQKIADYFKKEQGITISRRTIAKYREELNIPSSTQRKELVV